MARSLRIRSLRVRITIAATLVVAVTLAIAGTVLVHAVQHALESKVQDRARTQIQSVTAQLGSGIDPSQVTTDPSVDVYEQLPDGTVRVIGHSALNGQGLPAAGFVVSGSAAPGSGTGRADVLVGSGGERVEVPVGVAGVAGEPAPFDLQYGTAVVAGGPVTVVAATPLADVEGSISTLARSLLYAFPFVLVLVAAAAWFVVGRALRPVEAIRAEVEAISASTIHRPWSTHAPHWTPSRWRSRRRPPGGPLRAR